MWEAATLQDRLLDYLQQGVVTAETQTEKSKQSFCFSLALQISMTEAKAPLLTCSTFHQSLCTIGFIKLTLKCCEIPLEGLPVYSSVPETHTWKILERINIAHIFASSYFKRWGLYFNGELFQLWHVWQVFMRFQAVKLILASHNNIITIVCSALTVKQELIFLCVQWWKAKHNK